MTASNEFPGFVPPVQNWSKLPHALIDALPLFSSLTELKVVLYILRHTWGFQEFDKLKRITLDEFEKGRKYSPKTARKKGKKRMDYGTGMSRRALNEGIERALEHGFITRVTDGRDAGRSSHLYQLRDAEVASQAATVASQAATVASRSEKDTIDRYSGLPAPKSAQVTGPGAKEPSYAPGKELEYVPVEEEEDYERAPRRHKYEIPETQFQRDFLAVCKAKSFKPRQKTKVKKLTKCLAIGAGFLQEADGYRRCIEELEGHTNFPDRPLAMPASWYDWRAKHAREHRWSVNGFISALFDRDALVQHCQYKLKQLGATKSDERPAVPAPYDPPSGPTYR